MNVVNGIFQGMRLRSRKSEIKIKGNCYFMVLRREVAGREVSWILANCI